MAYSAPTATAAAFQITADAYQSPGAAAVDFNLSGSAFVFRKPPMIASVSFIHQEQLTPNNAHAVAEPHGSGAKVENKHGHRNNPSNPRNHASIASVFSRVPSRDKRAPYQWDQPDGVDANTDSCVWGEYSKKDHSKAHRWDSQNVKERKIEHPENIPAPHETPAHHRASDSAWNWQPPPDQSNGLLYLIPAANAADFDLAQQNYQPPGALVADINLAPDTEIIEFIAPTRRVDASQLESAWARQPGVDGISVHPWNTGPRIGTEVENPHGTEPNVPDNPEPDEPQDKRTYIIVNSSSLIAVASGQPLEFQDLTIQLDVDSYTWSMSAAILNRASMDQIRPTADGPAEVLATINGHQWSFLVESYSADNRFARERYQIQGVSRTQLLAAPYAPRRTGWIANATNMQQIIAQQLEFTGFSTTLQSGLTDYVVPAGAWGYTEKTALQVIAELAGALGAVVVPDPTEDELHIRHRYKQTPPWLYDSLQASEIDAIIQDTMVISYASRWDPQPEYNGVFVSGITHGVAIQVNRNGAAGDLAAPDVFDTLNVDTNQCRYRGMAILGASGPQEIVSIETILPTSGSPGLILPAQVVEYRDTRTPANTWRGNVLGVQIACSRPGTGRVKQTVHVERHHYPDGFGDIPTAAVLAGADLVMADDNLVIAS